MDGAPYLLLITRIGQNRIFGDFPAKNTVYALYIYGSGQPYLLPYKISF